MARKKQLSSIQSVENKNLVGIDLLEVSRIRDLFSNEKLWLRWIQRVGHPKELVYAKTLSEKQRICEFWAGRFAAKEAFAKALGTGIGKTLSFKEIGIIAGPTGKPEYILNQKIKSLLRQRGIKFVDLSISHTQNLAMAAVVLTRD